MDKATMLERLEAGDNPLELSIKKWEDILTEIEATREPLCESDMGTANCALCEIYRNRKPYIEMCKGCPILIKTGRKECDGTPVKWSTSTVSKAKKRAKAEIKFLKLLHALQFSTNEKKEEP